MFLFWFVGNVCSQDISRYTTLLRGDHLCMTALSLHSTYVYIVLHIYSIFFYNVLYWSESKLESNLNDTGQANFVGWSVLMGKWPKNGNKITIFQNWLKTHSKVSVQKKDKYQVWMYNKQCTNRILLESSLRQSSF